jgi:hypothetical protein
MNPQGFGAGVGRVAPYFEQGNWYRGGAVQMLFIAWIYGEQNQVRPMFPPNTSQEDLIRVSKSFDLAQQQPPVDWSKALWHLPVQDIIKAVDGPHGIFADAMPVDTGGRMIQRAPNDPAWYKGGLYHDDMPLNVPGLWFMSWYDVSVGPNLALYNHVRGAARPEIANEQWAVIAPTTHCGYTRATEDTVVGERHVGDARLNYDELTYGFFERFLKGESNATLEKLPKVTYYTMGLNKWQSSDTWPPAGARPMTFFLSSGGKANTMNGDGTLAVAPPASDAPDAFTYDPKEPVTSYGGNVCCTGNAITGGSFDQRKMEVRPDILVYTSEPFKEGTEVSGPIERRQGHRLHGKGPRRLSRRPRLQPGRVDPAHALSQRLRQAARVDGPGPGLQGHPAAADDEQLFRGGAPAADRGVEQQLPALRSQPQHRRPQLRRGGRRRRAQRGAPLEAVPVAGEDHGGETRRDRQVMIPGPWSLVLGPWSLVPGPWSLVHATGDRGPRPNV